MRDECFLELSDAPANEGFKHSFSVALVTRSLRENTIADRQIEKLL
jgi:hypothetical protein